MPRPSRVLHRSTPESVVATAISSSRRAALRPCLAGASSPAPSSRRLQRAPTVGAAIILAALLFVAPPPKALAQTITLDIEAFIDGRDQLIIHDNTLQWHHFDFVAVGWQSDTPTLITTSVDGRTVLNHHEWVPAWSAAPHELYDIEELSSVFEGLNPPITGPVTVSIEAIDIRENLSITQSPTSANGYTTVIEFNDVVSGGAEWYHARVVFEAIPEPNSCVLALTGAALIGGWFPGRRSRRPTRPAIGTRAAPQRTTGGFPGNLAAGPSHTATLALVALSACLALPPLQAAADPFTGVATEEEFCDTQSQFCDVNEQNPGGGAFDLALAVPDYASGDAIFTLSAYGDFEEGNNPDVGSETFRVDIEGFDLGFFLNNDPNDDLFDNDLFGDVGNDFFETVVATAIIPRDTLRRIIADGVFTVTFDSRTGINDIQGQTTPNRPNQGFTEVLSYQLSFDAIPIPEPTSGPLMTMAAALPIAARRRHERREPTMPDPCEAG